MCNDRLYVGGSETSTTPRPQEKCLKISGLPCNEGLVVASSLCLNPLTGNPLVKVKLQEPQLGPPKLYEGDTSFLDEASDKPFGASEMAGGS